MAYSSITKPSDHFNTKLYTGNGTDNNATQSINMGLQPDLCWIKNRNLTGASAQYHHVYDSVRGGNIRLVTSLTSAESTTNDRFNGITSTGFDLVQDDAGTNQNNSTYVAWGWKANGSGSANTDGSISSTVSANTTAGFSIITYTGTGSAATVGHGLGVAPKVTIFKRRDSTNSWRTQTTVIDGSLDNLYLNLTDVKVNASNSAPTSSVLNLDTGTEVNASSGTYVAYNFAEIKGYSKFGAYTGNGSTNGTFVYTGFKPAFLLIKSTSAGNTQNWRMADNKRLGYNEKNYALYPSATNGEGTEVVADLLSNGFKLRSTQGGTNLAANGYIYMAFAENPLVANISGGLPTTAR